MQLLELGIINNHRQRGTVQGVLVNINHGFGCSQPQPTLDKIVLYAGAGGICFEEVGEREGQTD